MPEPFALEILLNGLLSVADEMSEALRRSAYSPIIREMLDYSCALFDGKGRLVAESKNIPAQLGAMESALQPIVERKDIEERDIFICNHPYLGASHTPDVHLFHPVFGKGQPVAWSGTVAHHVDFGGRNPGTEGADNSEIYQEGLLLPPLKLFEKGKPNESLWSVIRANVREPETTSGDLRAQVAACKLGARRLLEMIGRHGEPGVRGAMGEAIDYSERRIRRALEEIADGETEAEGFLDDGGAGGGPVRLAARLLKHGDSLTVDFTGSSLQVAGALNNPLASTRAVVSYALKCVAGADIPQNHGCLRPVTIVAPEGSVVNPRPPAAVSVRHLTCQRLADVLLRALRDLAPERAVAGSFVGFFSIMAGGKSPKDGRAVVLQDIVGGGTGATRRGDGMDGVDTHMSNCGLLPAEVCETEYPFRILRTELLPDSGGAGRHTGGLGIRRAYQVLEHPQTVVVYLEQSNPRFAPEGLHGGLSGKPSRLVVIGPDGSEKPTPSKGSFLAEPGTIVRVETSGGGGFGDPSKRERERVCQDLREGRISKETARSIYGYLESDEGEPSG